MMARAFMSFLHVCRADEGGSEAAASYDLVNSSGRTRQSPLVSRDCEFLA